MTDTEKQEIIDAVIPDVISQLLSDGLDITGLTSVESLDGISTFPAVLTTTTGGVTTKAIVSVPISLLTQAVQDVITNANTATSAARSAASGWAAAAVKMGSDIVVIEGDISNLQDADKSLSSLTAYAECSTAANVSSKAVTVPFFSLPTNGGCLHVKMANANTAVSGVTLNINATGAKTLYYNGSAVSATNTWEDNEILEIYYDGTSYQATNAQGGGGSADKISFDNSQSGLSAENVQEAIDELSNNSTIYAEIQLSSAKTNIINNGNHWEQYNTDYQGCIMPVTSGDVYKIVTGDNDLSVAILKNNTTTRGTTPSYSSEYGARFSVDANSEYIFTAPSDANYIYFYVVAQGVKKTFTFNKGGLLKEYVESLPKDNNSSLTTVWKKPLNVVKNALNNNTGEVLESDVRLTSSYLYGHIVCRVKTGYCIYTGVVYNADGTYSAKLFEQVDATRREVDVYIEPYKYVRLVFAKSDTSLSISEEEDFIDVFRNEIDEKNKIVANHSPFNLYIKELYLKGTDSNTNYYVSSISLNHVGTQTTTTSLVIKEATNNTIVCSYTAVVNNGNIFNPPCIIELDEKNNSGVTGWAYVKWDEFFKSTLITDDNHYYVVDNVRSLDKWGVLSCYLNTNKSELKNITLVEDDGVVHTAWNYILKDVTISGARYLQFSKNLGETYTSTPNTYGDIVYVHFFSNGACLFATANKCYHFTDIANISESTLLDENGLSYTSNCILDFFQNDQSRNDCVMVGNTEMAVWGSYSLGVYNGTTYDANYRPRVWYSVDYGATVKCAISWSNTDVRHVHGAFYNPYNQKFIIATGDNGAQCRLYEGEYNTTDDIWDFTELGRGDNFKFGDVLFRNNFVYLVTDYTLSVNSYPRGILRCPYNLLSDYSKYEYICKVESTYSGSLIGTLEDDNGNKLLFPDGSGSGKIWYCKHNLQFVQIPMSENVVITNVGSPNYNGEIYARKSQGSASFPFKLSPMVNLTKSMRESGCTDFFVQNNVLL